MKILAKVAHGSAPFLSAFLLVHLSAPIMANVGGSSLASQVMVCALQRTLLLSADPSFV